MATTLSAALCLSLVAQVGGPQRPPDWLTFDIINPETVGRHRILHLEDMVGPRRRDDIPSLPQPKAVLLFTARPSECGALGRCAEVADATKAVRARGVLVLAVLLGTREEAAAARAEVRRAHHPFGVTFDVHGLIGRGLALETPGVFVIMNDEGLNVGRWTPSNAGDRAEAARQLQQVRTTLLTLIDKDEKAKETGP